MHMPKPKSDKGDNAINLAKTQFGLDFHSSRHTHMFGFGFCFVALVVLGFVAGLSKQQTDRLKDAVNGIILRVELMPNFG